MITRQDKQLRSIRAFMKGGRKQVRSAELASALPERVRRFATHTLEPGASIGYHVLEGESALIYFLEGIAAVQDDDRRHCLVAGDTLVTLSGHGHAIENAGDTDLVLLCVVIRD